MTKKQLTVEFRLRPTKTPPTPKPLPGEKAERLRQERAARKARNLALAYWIDGLVRSGEVKDLAAVSRTCGVSRARISRVTCLLDTAPNNTPSRVLAQMQPAERPEKLLPTLPLAKKVH